MLTAIRVPVMLSVIAPAGVMLTLAVISWLLYLRSEWQAGIQRGYSETMILAKSIATDLDGVFRDYELVMAEFANRPDVQSVRSSDCAPLVRSFASFHREFVGVSVRDRDGRLTCSSIPDAVEVLPAEYQALFEEARSRNAFYISDAIKPPPTDIWVTALAHPISDGLGNVNGVVIATLDLSRFSERLLESVPEEIIATIVDTNLNVAMRSQDDLRWLGQQLPKEITSIYRSGGEGNFRATDIFGVPRMGAFTELPRSRWIVALGYPEKSFLGPFKKSLFLGGLFGIFMIATALGVAFLMARFISRPIGRLSAAAHEFAGGNVAVREQAVGPLEVQRLCGQINDMFDAIVSLRQEEQSKSEMLQLSAERFRLVARATSDVVWDWNLETNQVWWGETLQSVFGHVITDPVMSLEEAYRFIADEDREHVSESLQKTFAGQGDIWRDRYKFKRADGTLANVVGSAFVVRDNAGNSKRVLGSIVDVTEHESLEEQLRQTQKLEIVGELTGGIAHDFNNLLTIILGNAELLEERVAGDANCAGMASQIMRAAERGSELIGHLLAYARKQPLSSALMKPEATLIGMQDLMEHALRADIELIISSESDWATLLDKTQFCSAILNLVVNARDAMPEGGRIIVTAKDEVVVGSNTADLADGEYVMVSVEDTGTGMSHDVLQRVVEPFFTTKDVGKGTGLGLSMVQGFVRQSGGVMEIESSPGAGTCIRMYFPRSAAAFGEVTHYDSEVVPYGKGERILIVEDDEDVGNYTTEQLRLAGYEVWHARNGQDALMLLERIGQIDVLLSDIVLPAGIDGPDLAKAIVREAPNVRVLFTSGYIEDVLYENGRVQGAVSLLRKPFNRSALLAAVSNVLNLDGPQADAES